MVVVVAASLVEPPSLWALAAPLAVIVTPAIRRSPVPAPRPRPLYKFALPFVAVAGAVACITLAVWAIFTNNNQAGIFVAFAVFGTATLPGHLECMLPPKVCEHLTRGATYRHSLSDKKAT